MFGGEERVEPLDDQGELRVRGTRPDLEGVVGRRDVELVEEEVGELRVVVLAAVDEDLLGAAA